MENAVESIMMTFAVIIFVIALALTMYLLYKTMDITDYLIYNSDKTNYFQNIQFESGNVGALRTRNVGIETVINSLYRYTKENFAVKLVMDNPNPYTLVEVFDASLESEISKISEPLVVPPAGVTDYSYLRKKALLSIYGDSSKTLYMFGAPWMALNASNSKEMLPKQRVDLYIAGKKGYINNVLVDYSGRGLYDEFYYDPSDPDKIIEETFVEYMWDGERIQTEGGLEQLDGNSKEKDKIIIEYRFKDKD